jgi:hypothetical protein
MEKDLYLTIRMPAELVAAGKVFQFKTAINLS